MTACRSSASASATSCSVARSASARTSCPFGHRGINQPVLDKTTGRVEITAHNHGFAVDAPLEGEFDSPNGYGRVEVSHVGLNDDVVEGLRALDIPAFSVQYHPEAAAGPHDANYLFDRFRDLVVATLKDSTNAQARRHQERPRHRLRPDRDRPGLRVRLLRNPGVPRAARGGRSRHPGQLEPGHDHDRPRLRRRDLHRADHVAGHRDDHREGAPRRDPADPGRPDRAERRDRPAQSRHPRQVRRRAHRRELRGDQQGRGPPDLQAARAGCRGRCRGIPHRAHRSRTASPPPPSSATRSSCAPRSRWADSARASRTTRTISRRIAGAGLHDSPTHRGAARGVDPRVEGVRARAHARHGRQHGRGLLDRERRPGRRAHRRLDHRRPRAHAHRPRVPEAARHRHRHHPRGRRRHGRLQHPVRRRPRERPHHRDRDEPARLALVGARLEGDRLPDREDRREARDRLPARRDPERHHEGDAGELRADPGLRRRQGAALQLREVPGRRHDAHDDHEVGRRGHGDRPQLRDGPAEGAPLAREARIELPLGRRAPLAR